jgi:hypothetical protein
LLPKILRAHFSALPVYSTLLLLPFLSPSDLGLNQIISPLSYNLPTS